MYAIVVEEMASSIRKDDPQGVILPAIGEETTPHCAKHSTNNDPEKSSREPTSRSKKIHFNHVIHTKYVTEQTPRVSTQNHTGQTVRRTRLFDSMSSLTMDQADLVSSSGRSRPRSSGHQDNFAKLDNLHQLFEQGFLSSTEFKERRNQLVDELTGTSSNTGSRLGQSKEEEEEEEEEGSRISRSSSSFVDVRDIPRPMPPIVYHPPPDFTTLRTESGIKHTFEYESRHWSTCPIQVKLDDQPFAKGGLRMVYHLQDVTDIDDDDDDERALDETQASMMTYVAKVSIDPNEDDETYFRDVEMQAVAADYAQLYNSYLPPRRVAFVQAWICQLTERARPAGRLVNVEPFIVGDYRKHNNNCGYVSDLERNTPQAFSHFTFEASNHEILVVDIQGVGDHYTDPQIHTRSGKEFGKGNLSMRGFDRFLSSHRCNAICRYLKLPLINPRESRGTIPQQTYMSHPRVSHVTSEFRHMYDTSRAYQQRKTHRSSSSSSSSPRRQRQRQQLLHDEDVEVIHQPKQPQDDDTLDLFSWCGLSSCVIQ